MIDPKDGSITIDTPHMTITRAMTCEQFLQSPAATIATPLNKNAPWSRYGFQPIVIGGERFYAEACFHTGRLYSVDLSVMRAEFGASWSDWSEDRELARKQLHDSLLASALGADWSRQRFTWGGVYSVFDPKSGGSSIGVTYGYAA
jgi:hypothetical protein